jgi:prepilin-type N-terminal cleavage/methylation domain-containing protein
MQSRLVAARTGQVGGFTLIEIIAAAAVAAVVAGGSMLALVAASRMMRRGDTPAIAEASGYAQQTIEKFRNMIACDSPWFGPGCAPSGGMPTNWVEDQLPDRNPANTESFLDLAATTPKTARRCYRVRSRDCDGVASPDDCFEIEVKVLWNQTPAPACNAL